MNPVDPVNSADPSASIEVDQFLPHPPATVWAALTTPELLARWWAPGDVRPVVGHRFTLDMGPWGHQVCEVIEVEPERLLRYTFAEQSLDTVISWRLRPEGTGTRLFLVHDGFDLGTDRGQQAHEGMGGGWPGVVGRLATVLAEAPAR